mmetsp:Transcript_37049/g.106962  ORF Transcript_37049/g.106962 Transcript_37049/m.106962 type:complete len:200 (+) Transcript_37049:44-643(+)
MLVLRISRLILWLRLSGRLSKRRSRPVTGDGLARRAHHSVGTRWRSKALGLLTIISLGGGWLLIGKLVLLLSSISLWSRRLAIARLLGVRIGLHGSRWWLAIGILRLGVRIRLHQGGWLSIGTWLLRIRIRLLRRRGLSIEVLWIRTGLRLRRRRRPQGVVVVRLLSVGSRWCWTAYKGRIQCNTGNKVTWWLRWRCWV